jgi:hypothetical protein
MEMYNFDFMERTKGRPLETRNYMIPSLRAARTRCERLFENYGKQIGASSVRVRENGGTKVLYEWPEE